MFVSDPIFSIRTPQRVEEGSLFDVMAAACNGALVDLPMMQAHQRGPTVTALAIMMVALQRYAEKALRGASDWSSEWDQQIGEDALRLVAPHNEPAFLQPPTEEGGSPNTMAEADWLFQSQAHEVKPVLTGSPEQWVFALMGSTWRQYGGRGRYSGVRVGLLVVLPGDGQTLASEIMALVNAFQQMNPGVVGQDAAPRLAADHMLWMQPYGKDTPPLAVAECPYPFIDCRPLRLEEKDGQLRAVLGTTKNARVDVAEGHIADPHAPLKDGRTYRVVMSRRFDYRLQHAALFGSGEVQRPRILDMVDFTSMRICAAGTAPPGKTAGYWEAVYAATRKPGGFRLRPATEDNRPAELSQRMLDTLKTGGSNVLWPALQRLLEADSDRVAQGMERMRAQAGTASVQLVLDLLQSEADLEAEQQAMQSLVGEAVLMAFDYARSAVVDPLLAADAEGYLRWALSHHLGGATMDEHEEWPHLAKQTYAIIANNAEHLTPDDRATLRTMYLSEPPLLFWTLLASVPRDQTENDACVEVWRVILRGMGRVRAGGRSFGRVLAETDFPRDRMSRLLVATGSALTGLLDEAVRWLVSHDVENADLTVPATLGLSDALGDIQAREWARRRIGLDFVRQEQRGSERAA